MRHFGEGVASISGGIRRRLSRKPHRRLLNVWYVSQWRRLAWLARNIGCGGVCGARRLAHLGIPAANPAGHQAKQALNDNSEETVSMKRHLSAAASISRRLSISHRRQMRHYQLTRRRRRTAYGRLCGVAVVSAGVCVAAHVATGRGDSAYCLGTCCR